MRIVILMNVRPWQRACMYNHIRNAFAHVHRMHGLQIKALLVPACGVVDTHVVPRVTLRRILLAPHNINWVRTCDGEK